MAGGAHLDCRERRLLEPHPEIGGGFPVVGVAVFGTPRELRRTGGYDRWLITDHVGFRV
jgi:hypothetical protein